MVGGAGGGTHGPSAVYPDLSARLAGAGVAALQLDYRRPNHLAECVQDTLGAVEMLADRGISRIALIGWSFGGAVVITAGARSDAVVGVATVASQTYGTDAVSHLAPKRLLLIHGTSDSVLPDTCSRSLYALAGEPKELVLYQGDGHGIERHRQDLLDKLYSWCVATLDAAPASLGR